MAFTKKIAGWVAGRIKGEQARKDTMRWMEKTGLGMILDAAGDYALAQGALKGAGKLKGLLTGGGQAAQAGKAAAQTQAAIAAGPKPSASLISSSVPTAPARAISQAAATPSPASLGMGAAKAAPIAAPVAAPVAAPAAMQAPMQAMVAPGAPAFQPSAAGQAASGAVRGMTPPAPSPMQAMTAPATAPAPVPTGAPTGGMTSGMTPSMRADLPKFGGYGDVANANMTRGVGGFRGAAQFARENASWLGPAATATGNVIGSAMDRSIEQEKLDREQRARNNLAQLLMPLFQSQMGQMGSSFQPRG